MNDPKILPGYHCVVEGDGGQPGLQSLPGSFGKPITGPGSTFVADGDPKALIAAIDRHLQTSARQAREFASATN